MLKHPQIFTSLSGEWETPDALYTVLDKEFNFTLDVCATPRNAKCPNYYSGIEGLFKPWQGVIWCNPPYGREIGNWISKGLGAARDGAIVVMLVPSRTDTRWWHDYCMKGKIRFLKGRLYFTNDEGKTGRATFPSAIIVFKFRQ